MDTSKKRDSLSQWLIQYCTATTVLYHDQFPASNNCKHINLNASGDSRRVTCSTVQYCTIHLGYSALSWTESKIALQNYPRGFVGTVCSTVQYSRLKQEWQFVQVQYSKRSVDKWWTMLDVLQWLSF